MFLVRMFLVGHQHWDIHYFVHQLVWFSEVQKAMWSMDHEWTLYWQTILRQLGQWMDLDIKGHLVWRCIPIIMNVPVDNEQCIVGQWEISYQREGNINFDVLFLNPFVLFLKIFIISKISLHKTHPQYSVTIILISSENIQ